MNENERRIKRRSAKVKLEKYDFIACDEDIEEFKGCFVIVKYIIFALAISLPMCLWTDRSFDYIFQKDIPLFASWIVSFILNIFTLILNIIVEIIRVF